jgi:CheY-like chemotaxis protein
MGERILIVDDDFETLRMVGLMLQRQGYSIIAANNGEQALLQAKSERPDLIILDIMMPSMDGFQVCQLLRADPLTENTPVLMFTAKGQLDDKVAGYDAGADDYLTKPVHPAELIAHIKALLARRAPRPLSPTPIFEKGKLVGILGGKGGLGVSALTLNLAIGIAKKSKINVVAAETHPGNGSWAIDLGFMNPNGLNNLLNMKTHDINRDSIEKQLVKITYGPRLLLAGNNLSDGNLVTEVSKMEMIIQHLPQIGELVLVDFGVPTLPNIERLLNYCDELLLVIEPFPSCLEHTKVLTADLARYGFGKSKLLHLVIINRIRADMQLSVTQLQEALKIKVTQMIPPAPEVAILAAEKNIPLIELQPEGLLTQQFERLADFMLERIQK